MGIKKQAFYKDYWSSNEQLRDPYISSIMPVNRFSWFLSHLHINDNLLAPKRNEPHFDKLYKVRPLLDSLSKTFLQHFNPNEHQSIDESMIVFKGRSTLKQYMPIKPVKRGYKVWIRADQTGYVCQFDVYTGKTDSTETSLGKRVVLNLTKNIYGHFHKIFFDNFFTSFDLMEELLQNKVYACGTVHAKRKNQILDKNMQKGES